MTIQEIVESIDYCLERNNDNIPTAQEDLQTIKKALEKQIPKKPIKELNEVICPNCKTLVGSSPFCRYCGQALYFGDLNGIY